MTDHIVEHTRCRSCAGRLEEVLHLGDLRLNAFPLTTEELEAVPRVSLVLMVCGECGLVQLDRTVPPDWLYRKYWYKSGVNEMMVAELRAIVKEACQRVPVAASDCVLDIGANDGTLLAAYADQPGYCPIRVAVEPALNLADVLRKTADIVVHDYFPAAVPALTKAVQGYRIITAIACAYDVEDPLAFFQGIETLLHPEGVAIVQFQDFGQQITASAFDNICHEHLEYYTLWSLMHLTNRAGLEIVDVQQTPINGGSLRVTLQHPIMGFGGDRIRNTVALQLTHEMQLRLDTPTIRGGDLSAFGTFAHKVTQARVQIDAALAAAFAENRVVDVYGASTKGNILLQVLGLGPEQIRYAIDRSPEKHGLLTITGIPIVGEETAHLGPADIWLCPIWQFRESVLRREAWYLEQGGTILFPLPAVEIVRASWRAPE